jgi:hypothetical protein
MNNLDKPTLDKWNGNYLPSEVSYNDKNIKELYNEDIKANIPPNAPADEKVTNVLHIGFNILILFYWRKF